MQEQIKSIKELINIWKSNKSIPQENNWKKKDEMIKVEKSSHFFKELKPNENWTIPQMSTFKEIFDYYCEYTGYSNDNKNRYAFSLILKELKVKHYLPDYKFKVQVYNVNLNDLKNRLYQIELIKRKEIRSEIW